MRGLVLEGGGVKGAYHIGILKALREDGSDKFDGYVGTSIGAINAAMLAAGDWDKTLDMWHNINVQNVLDIDENNFRRIMKGRFNVEFLGDVGKVVGNLGGFIDTTTDKMRAYFKDYIDEEAIRRNNVDFGLVTYSVPDFEPHYMMKEDIPEGQLYDYVMASAAYPAFKWQKIEGKENKWFIDGGVYDNLPVKMLSDKNYDDIVAIRTNIKKFLPYRKVDTHGAKMTYYIPSEKLEFAIKFTSENVEKFLAMGYYDAKRRLLGMDGSRYCVNSISGDDFKAVVDNIGDDSLVEIVKMFKLKPHKSREANLEDFFDILRDNLSMRDNTSDINAFISFVEIFAELFKVNRFRFYELQDLCNWTMEYADNECRNNDINICELLRRDRAIKYEIKQIFTVLYNGRKFD